MRPDGKSQVSVTYVDNKPQNVQTVVISTQHAPDISNEEIKRQITDKVIKPVCGKWWNGKAWRWSVFWKGSIKGR